MSFAYVARQSHPTGTTSARGRRGSAISLYVPLLLTTVTTLVPVGRPPEGLRVKASLVLNDNIFAPLFAFGASS